MSKLNKPSNLVKLASEVTTCCFPILGPGIDEMKVILGLAS